MYRMGIDSQPLAKSAFLELISRQTHSASRIDEIRSSPPTTELFFLARIRTDQKAWVKTLRLAGQARACVHAFMRLSQVVAYLLSV